MVVATYLTNENNVQFLKKLFIDHARCLQAARLVSVLMLMCKVCARHGSLQRKTLGSPYLVILMSMVLYFAPSSPDRGTTFSPGSDLKFKGQPCQKKVAGTNKKYPDINPGFTNPVLRIAEPRRMKRMKN